MSDLAGLRLIVFTKTAGYRHASISDGVAMFSDLAQAHEWKLTCTEDSSVLTGQSLARTDVVVWLSTSGDVVSPEQRVDFEDFIRDGGGYVGIHAAADTESSWPFYRKLVGATFRAHSGLHLATVRVEDRGHPSTSVLPTRWSRVDEWYDYHLSPRGRVRVLATVDESTYDGGTMGADHPIAWCHTTCGGPAWYTGLGHTPESFYEPMFRDHVRGGVTYAAGHCPADGRDRSVS
jgi:cytochrome c